MPGTYTGGLLNEHKWAQMSISEHKFVNRSFNAITYASVTQNVKRVPHGKNNIASLVW